MKKLFLLLSVLIILLLISCESHDHVYDEWVVASEPTCSAEGVKTRSCDCGDLQSAPIEKTEHVYGEWHVVKEATCTEEGQKQRVCVCGDEQTEVIEKTEHVFGEWETTASTCAKEGAKTRVCVCGEKETEQLPKTSHNYGEWAVTTESTCAEAGVEARSCKVCGDKDTRSLTTKSHKWTGGDCDEPRTCSDCGAEDEPVHLFLSSNFSCRECGTPMTFSDYSYLARDIFRGIRDEYPSAKATGAKMLMYHALNGNVYALISVSYTVDGKALSQLFIHNLPDDITAGNGALYFTQLAQANVGFTNSPGFSTYMQYMELAQQCKKKQDGMDTDPDTITISAEYLNS